MPGARARRASALTQPPLTLPLLAAKAFNGAAPPTRQWRVSHTCISTVGVRWRRAPGTHGLRIVLRHDEWHADWSLFRNCLVTGAAIGCAGQECAARAAAGARTVCHAPRTRRAARRISCHTVRAAQMAAAAVAASVGIGSGGGARRPAARAAAAHARGPRGVRHAPAGRPARAMAAQGTASGEGRRASQIDDQMPHSSFVS